MGLAKNRHVFDLYQRLEVAMHLRWLWSLVTAKQSLGEAGMASKAILHHTAMRRGFETADLPTAKAAIREHIEFKFGV